MRVTSWIRAEIVNWLGVDNQQPIRLSFDDKTGAVTFNYPDPSLIERRKRIVAAIKSQWAIAIGSAIIGAVIGKLL